MQLFALAALLTAATALAHPKANAKRSPSPSLKHSTTTHTVHRTSTQTSGPTGNPSIIPGTNFDSWGFLIMENTDYATAEANPVFQQIQNMGNNRLLSNYLAISHPSEPNYLASIAGTDFGITDDGPVSSNSQSGPNVLDLLEKKGISWKVYAESYPGNCFLGATAGGAHAYASKHVPALYFDQINKNSTRCANVVDASEFATDLAAGTLPQWWYYVPTLNNDGHDTDTAYVANYLKTTWLPRFNSPAFMKGLAMVLTYDENETTSAANHVYAALIGGALKSSGHVDATAYNHYSLIKTVEDNWSLGNLGAGDVGATAIRI
jgi:hypothetical protein